VTNRRQSAAPVPPLLFGSPETKFVNLPPTGPPVLPPAQNCGPLSQTQVPSTALSLAPSQRSAPPSKPLTNVFSPEDAISARLQPARHAESDVKRHPTVTFRSTQIRDGGGGSLEVAGELTIRGKTRRIALEVGFFSRSMPSLPPRISRRVLVQGSLDLSLVRHAPHGRDSRALDDEGAPRRDRRRTPDARNNIDASSRRR